MFFLLKLNMALAIEIRLIIAAKNCKRFILLEYHLFRRNQNFILLNFKNDFD